MKYWLFIVLLAACNPVKQVLKDKEKLDQVAEVVVKAGYCANDTTIITKSDTTYSIDTIYDVDTLIDLRLKNDTQYVKVPKVITRTIVIRDTIKNVVVDNARINAIQKEVTRLELLEKICKDDANYWKKLAQKRWWNLVWLIILFTAYILRKPILRFIRWQFVKF